MVTARQTETPHPPEAAPSSADSDEPGVHSYPVNLARHVAARWADVDMGTAEPLPDLDLLERLLSVCYHVSLLREEDRPITFRLALAAPSWFPAGAGPPAGLHRVTFATSRSLDEHELRRLAPVAPFHRSLIGASVEPGAGLVIWGLIHSGPGWLQSVRGGRDIDQVVPSVLMIAVTGPGRLLVSKGTRTLAELSDGKLATASVDVFEAGWLPGVFRALHDAQADAHQRSRARSDGTWAALDPQFGRSLAEHALRRVVATIRGAQHGGTLIVLPSERAADILRDDRYITLKYALRDEEPRRRILTVAVRIMDELARLSGRASVPSTVGWMDYEMSTEATLAELDEALFEASHLVAALAQIDGAVVATTELDVLGFGGEISGALPPVATVARALDLDGARREWVRTDRVGTRHRSVYRLCQALQDALAIVVSQDGGVRFVRWHAGCVTYWNQIATGPWEV